MKRNNFGSTIWLFFLLASLSLIISLFGTNSTSSAQTPKPTPVPLPTPKQGARVDGSESTNHPQANQDIVTVSSTEGWVNTNLSVQAGDQFTISYVSGSWTVDYRNFSYVGPNGYPYYEDSQIASGCKQVPELPYARLIGAISGGSTFDVAIGRTFTAGNSGFLNLRINDMDHCLVDNDGSVVVELTYESDTTAPTVYWVAPVENQQVHEVSGGTVDLEVSASDDKGVVLVKFWRWDAVNWVWIGLGMDENPPYEATVDVDTLNMGLNQIVAEAYDQANNVGTEDIWILRGSNPDLRQDGEIVVSGDLVEGGTVYLTIPVKNFGSGHSPAMHVYTEGHTGKGELWRADDAQPTAVVLDPGEGVDITVQHELWSGHAGRWDTSIGVFIWNDDTSDYHGPLPANGHEQNVEFNVEVEAVGLDLRQNGPIVVSGDLTEGGTAYLTIPVKNFGDAASPAMHAIVRGYSAKGEPWLAFIAQPTAVVLQPGESVEFTARFTLWAGDIGWWDTSGGVFIWNDDTTSDYGSLAANGYDQNVDFYVEAADSSIDMGFRPDLNGYSFDNYGGVYPQPPASNDFTHSDTVRMFGEEQTCASGVGNDCIINESAFEWNVSINDAMNGGHCDGMTTTSLRFFKSLDNPGDFQNGAQSIHDLQKDSIRRHIAYNFALQDANPVAAARNDGLNKTPNEVLEQINLAMQDGAPDPVDLIIYSSSGAGHSILPYAIERKGNDIYWVKVYDNNHHDDGNRHVEFNKQANSWSYNLGAGLGTWSGDEHSRSIGVIPLSVYRQQPQCPFCGATTALNGNSSVQENTLSQTWLNGDGQLLITDSSGRRIGFVDQQFVNEIPAAFESLPVGGLGLRAEPIYYLPDSDGYTFQLSGTSPTQSDGVSIAHFGPGFSASVSDLSLDSSSQDRLTISSDGSEITYAASNSQEAKLTMTAEGSTSRRFEVQGIDIRDSEGVTMERDSTANQLIVSHEQAGDGVYTLELREIDENGISSFLHNDLVIGSGDTHIFELNTWDGSGTITVCYDLGSDGKVDDCTDIENENPGMIYLPNILRP